MKSFYRSMLTSVTQVCYLSILTLRLCGIVSEVIVKNPQTLQLGSDVAQSVVGLV